MKSLEKIQEEIILLEKEEWRINHLKLLAKSDIIYTPRPLREPEKLFLKNFDKMSIKKLCEVTGLGHAQVYAYFKRFDKCISKLSIK